MGDADLLVRLAAALRNQRKNRMRRELREQLGRVLRIRVADRSGLDCVESDQVFIVLKPASDLGRDDFTDPRPLLRQALVAGCAAFETYLADKAMSRVGPLLSHQDSLTPRLERLPLTLGTWMEIQSRYQRKGWGVRQLVVEPASREAASTASSRIGEIMSMVGVDKWSTKVDAHRKVPRGQTVEELDRITRRRNRIAHEADRTGRGRAPLSVEEVRKDLDVLRSVVAAIEAAT